MVEENVRIAGKSWTNLEAQHIDFYGQWHIQEGVSDYGYWIRAQIVNLRNEIILFKHHGVWQAEKVAFIGYANVRHGNCSEGEEGIEDTGFSMLIMLESVCIYPCHRCNGFSIYKYPDSMSQGCRKNEEEYVFDWGWLIRGFDNISWSHRGC